MSTQVAAECVVHVAAKDHESELRIAECGKVRPHFGGDAVSVQLWYLQAHAANGGFLRCVMKGSGAEVQLPVGPAVGLAFDDHGRVVAVSKPVTVSHGAVADLPVRPPARGADLVVLIDRPSPVPGSAPEQLLLNGAKRPDVSLAASDHLLGIWYGLSPGKVDVAMTSDVNRLAPLRVTLKEGRTESLHASATPLPKIHVTVFAPAGSLENEQLSLRIERASHTAIRNAPVAVGKALTFEALPAEPLDLVLSLRDWEFHHSADLSPGADADVVFDLDPIVVSGTVTYGGNPVAAEVGFSVHHLYKTRADEKGKYRMVLWHHARYAIRVALPDHPEIPPYLDTLRFETSRTLDIDIPRARYVAAVTDSGSGSGVKQAKLTITNEFDDRVEGHRKIMSQAVTDDQGRSYLPPLRAGNVRVRADADGYLAAEVRSDVSDGTDDVVLAIPLERIGPQRTLRVVLPDGSPGAGAELLAVSPSDEVLYTSAAGSDGTIRVPNRFAGALLVLRHPSAGSVIRLLTESDDAEITWQMPNAAPPLTFRAVSADTRAAGSSPLFLWIGDVRLGGVALGFFARSNAATSADGSWTGFNLPPAPIRVLVLNRSTGGLTANVNAFRSLAQTVTYPWPGALTVRAY